MCVINFDNLQQMKKWVGFVGMFMLIMGIIIALFGFAILVIGAIPGIICIVLATRLLDAKQAMALILDTNPEDQSAQLNLIVVKLTSYFMIQSIFFIISLVVLIIAVLFAGIFPFLPH